MASTAADTSKTTVNTAQENVESVKAMAEENVQMIKELVQENAETIKETAQEVLNYTQQAAQTIGERIGLFEMSKEEEAGDFGASPLHNALTRWLIHLKLVYNQHNKILEIYRKWFLIMLLI
jgi:vacuolar-type H+-ATPase subunit H